MIQTAPIEVEFILLVDHEVFDVQQGQAVKDDIRVLHLRQVSGILQTFQHSV